LILVTVSPHSSFHRETNEALGGRLRFEAHWQISYYDTTRLRTAAADQQYIVIIDFVDPKRAMLVARAVDGRAEFAVLAVGGGSTREDVLQLMRAGIREVLPEDSPEELRQAARRALAKLTSTEEQAAQVFSFVPAKPGCGATTLATHASSAAARMTKDPTLLLDFDIRLGVTSFLLKAGGNHTVMDALQQADRLDPDLWASMVSQCGNLHVVGSGPVNPAVHIAPERFTQIIDFASQIYTTLAVDLPGTMEEHEAETLLRSKRIFLVCTPDIGALHVARRKSSWLRDLGLAGKVSMVLNCVERRSSLGVADIERIVEMPVRYMVPAGPGEIARAVQKGVAVEGSSPLAKEIAKIAAEMVSLEPVVKKANPVRRFVEYFSIGVTGDGRSG